MSATIETPATIDEQITALEAEREGKTGQARSVLTRKINQLLKERDEIGTPEDIAAARQSLKAITDESAEPAIDAMTDTEVTAELKAQTAEAERAGERPLDVGQLDEYVIDALDTAREKFDEFDDEQKQRAVQAPRVKGGLRGKALVAWILGGKAGVEAQAADGRARAAAEKATSKKPRKRKGTVGASEEDITAATMASEIAAERDKPLSQRITPREAMIARAAMSALIAERVSAGHFPNAPADAETTPSMFPAALGFTSERAFRAYVNGSEKTLKDDAKAGVKDLTRRIGSHQVWARKAAAAAFGVMRQMQS